MPNQTTPVPENRPKNFKKRLIIKTVLITFLVLVSAAGLVYAGFWYGQKQTAEGAKKSLSPKKPSQTEEQVKEVPFGDEEFQNNEEYQKSMEEYEDEGCTGEDCSWITYKNEAKGFSFQYPSTVFLEKTDGVNLPLVFLDTKLIIIPEGYGGFLTPVEINVRGEKTYQEATENLSEDIFYPNTYQEEKLKTPLKGIRVSGTCQGFPCDGQEHHLIYLDGPKGLININYTPDSDRFPKSLFNKILTTFRFL